MGLGSSIRRSKTGWILILAVLLVGLALLPGWGRPLVSILWQLGPIGDTGETRLLIAVEDGRLLRLNATSLDRTLRATSIAMQEARSPEAGEMDLAPWEGKLLLLEGRDSGGWLYSARIVRPLSPLERSIAPWAWPAAARSPSP